MSKTRNILTRTVAVIAAVALTVGVTGCSKKSDAELGTAENPYELLNVSYDPTRELYEQFNPMFEEYYKQETGKVVEVTNSHGGSGGQANSVVEGSNKADVLTLALANDITKVEKAGMIQSGWIDEFDKQSSPYTSTIVFLVRKGNPKGIQDWDDIVQEGVEVITPDPSTSGGACWNFLAAWYYAEQTLGAENTDAIKDFMVKLFANVTVMDSGARASTLTFTDNKQGDVLLAWENEAIATLNESPDDFEIVSPSISILAQPSVAIVDEIADKNGTQEVAKAYLEYLYTDEAQKLIAENGYRPSNEEILKDYSDKFADIEMITIDHFGGWGAAFDTYFNEGTIFDEIMTRVNASK